MSQVKILVIAEHDHHVVRAATFNAISAAQQISATVDVLVLGFRCEGAVQALQKCSGVSNVLFVDDSAYEHQLAENISKAIAQIGTSYTHIIAAATTFGKNVMPRIAALLDVGQISDVKTIIDDATFIRPIYAGNALQKVHSKDPIKIVTIRSTAFSANLEMSGSAAAQPLNVIYPPMHCAFVKQEISQLTRPELTSAKIVVAGGRALASSENFKLLEDLADKLGAAIGASRAAVDAGYVPNDYQVGQTGKVVAPVLYIAVGISGAIQHVAGMKDSKIIVAINKDPDAPIFKIADYGLVGDLFDIIPEMTRELSTPS